MKQSIKIKSRLNQNITLKVTPGHFSSDRFHINYYIDMTTLKMRQKEALMVAKAMSKKYMNYVSLSDISLGKFDSDNLKALSKSVANVKPIDTIICLDGCEAIGAYMSQELSDLGVTTLNKHQSMYILTPEFDQSGQMVVRDNIKTMIKGKHILIILASAMSGHTIQKTLKCIKAYGGSIQGISVIFGNVDKIDGCPVNAVFTTEDLPDFKLSDPNECEQCKNNIPLDAIVNSYGYSEL